MNPTRILTQLELRGLPAGSSGPSLPKLPYEEAAAPGPPSSHTTSGRAAGEEPPPA